MDKDSATSAIKKVLGSIQEALGRAIGDRTMEAEGRAKKIEGAAQKTAGGTKDATREINGQQ